MTAKYNYNFLTRTKPALFGIIVFAILLILTQFLAFQKYDSLKNENELDLSNQAVVIKERLNQIANQNFATTQTLSYIIENSGVPENFDSIAQNLKRSNNFADVLEIVEGTIVTHAYPLSGNNVIGFDILKSNSSQSGVISTLQKENFYISGPIYLKQGGVAIASRLPIYKNGNFWGFSVILTHLSTVLKTLGIDSVGDSRFAYQIAQKKQNSNEETFFIKNEYSLENAISVPFEIYNGEWRIYVIGKKSITVLSVMFYILLGLALSILGGLFTFTITRQPYYLEKLVNERTTLLEKSETNYKKTIERISDAFVSVDENFCFTYINKKAAELFEINPTKILGKNIWSEFNISSDNPFYTTCISALKTQLPTNTEVYFDKLDVWYENRILPSKTGLLIFYKNINEIKNTNKTLKLFERRNEVLLNAIPDLMFIINNEGVFTDYNNSNNETTYTEPSFFLGKNILNVMPKELAETTLKNVLLVLANNDKIVHQYQLEYTKGVTYFEARYFKLNEEEVLIIVRDISQEKRSHIALMESEENFRHIMERISDGFIALDNDWIITYANNKASLILERENNELIGKNIWTFYPESRNKPTLAALDRTKLAQVHETYSIFYEDISRWFEYQVYPSKDGLSIFFRDITKKKKTHLEIEEYQQKLKQLAIYQQELIEEERTRISREIHDELGQQMTALKYDIAWLNREYSDKDKYISEKVHSMNKLTNETLSSIRRISSNLRPRILDDLGLNATVEWYILAYQRNTDINVLFQSNLDDLQFDKDISISIYRIIQESLTNVARHSKASHVILTLNYTNNELILEIKDNGIGFCLIKSEKSLTMGIFGIKERVEIMNGQFNITSEPNLGTTIIVKVPIN